MTAPGPGSVTGVVDGQVGRVTISHTGKFNAVTNRMWEQLAEVMGRLGADERVRVVVLRGDGGVFSSGADLRELLAATESERTARAFSLRVARALHALAGCPVPTVAALERHVAGGGAEIALACDLRVARSDVVFQIPMARLGMVPDRLTLHRLTQVAGPSTARAVLLAGRAYDAAACLRVGLADEVVPEDGLDAAVEEWAGALVAGSAYSISRTKTMLLTAEGLADPDELVEEMVAAMVEGGVADNARAFLERARPARS